MPRLFSVALVGPDGSGKTTISRRLLETLPLPIKYVYMGVNPDSSNLMLPTTWLLSKVKRGLGAEPDTRGPRAIEDAVKPKPKNPVKRALVEVQSGLGYPSAAVALAAEEGQARGERRAAYARAARDRGCCQAKAENSGRARAGRGQIRPAAGKPYRRRMLPPGPDVVLHAARVCR